ncbi:hypothetical protein P7K49_037602 [Saguinus oedipus]|uniref:40S ribosomal protein S11 n=1 Tax=Saguinus oedipus TaxID=9490 RepID=A0ABQ9TIK5_SAGOE|nr:hypothetical protein P7K49_037602 [Saguinus oedipus]
MSVHLLPCFRDVQIGDTVTVGKCRLLSKMARFNVFKVTKASGTKKVPEVLRLDICPPYSPAPHNKIIFSFQKKKKKADGF